MGEQNPEESRDQEDRDYKRHISALVDRWEAEHEDEERLYLRRLDHGEQGRERNSA
jgi:hypothetical protein